MVDSATSGRGAARERAARNSRGPRHDKARHQVRIPGFAREGTEIGLGDAVARVTSTVGIRPCGGCGRRAEALNRWMTIDGGRDR
ncbi:hypothetical protein ACFVZW_30430 [Streptomyces sp. NPDC059567]|uniref:hypothetical protein n=1 Tax=Streptomyces sp. NPDC059567 TaxID=3346867 RepID=UPI00367E480A